MSSTLATAVSGLAAQCTKLAVSADNIANLRSAGVRPDTAQPDPKAFVPQRTELASQAEGGVRAVAVPVSAPSVLEFDPSGPNADADGVVARPNVSLAREFVTQIEAQRAFEANLAVVKAEDKRLGTLLDLIS
jgi:flagellar basal-body rod protein FlgC